ncbi:MAG: hypothetical protein U1E65_11655 [Myxococcota bacterium]
MRNKKPGWFGWGGGAILALALGGCGGGGNGDMACACYEGQPNAGLATETLERCVPMQDTATYKYCNCTVRQNQHLIDHLAQCPGT